MICPKCGSKMKTIDSRECENVRIRQYKCLKCNRMEFTKEEIINYIDGLDMRNKFVRG